MLNGTALFNQYEVGKSKTNQLHWRLLRRNLVDEFEDLDHAR